MRSETIRVFESPWKNPTDYPDANIIMALASKIKFPKGFKECT
jgi:hypothetical protein